MCMLRFLGPLFVHDMVGPLTSVSHFRSSVKNQLKDLKRELCLDLTEEDQYDISVDDLKILSDEELVDIAFQATLKGGNTTIDNSLSSEECSVGTTNDKSEALACLVKSGIDEDYVPTNGLLRRSKRTNGNGMMKGAVSKKNKRVTRKDAPHEGDYMAEVEKVVKITQKQDKSAARLHSFSGDSGPTPCASLSEKKEQMSSFNYTSLST